MMQEIEQTRAEKIAMYMRLRKQELAEMLVNANEVLASRLLRLTAQPDIGSITFGPPPTVKFDVSAYDNIADRIWMDKEVLDVEEVI